MKTSLEFTLQVCLLSLLLFTSCLNPKQIIDKEPVPDEERARQMKDMKFGMFICWSLSTFSGKEWTGEELPVDFSVQRNVIPTNGRKRQRRPI